MSPSLKLHGVSFAESGPTVELALSSRQSLSVFGPAGSGKTQFLRICAGLEKPRKGSVSKIGKVALTDFESFGRRNTPLSLAQEASGKNAQHAAEALGALNLWDCRKKSISALSPGQQLASRLLLALADAADLMLLDGHLDLLDPWAFRDVLVLLQKRVARGAILAVATHQAKWAEMTDGLLVLRDQKPVFQGTFEELAVTQSPAELRVETRNQEGVRALCGPFDVVVSNSSDAMTIRSAEGQTLAARMLTEGYGDVRAVTLKKPGARELLEGLIR